MKLAELLEATGLRVVAGPRQGLDASISWVHTTELLDPSMYLSGGELILTTGLWRRRKGDAQRFVGVLRASGVSAMGYGLPAPDTTVPSDLLDACAEHRLCIVEVPFETPFIAISKAFVGWLTETRQSWLVKALRRSEAMTMAIRRGGGVEGILRVLRRDCAIRAAVVSRSGRVLATTGPPLGRDRLARLLAATRAATTFPLELGEPPGPLTISPIHATGPADGYLVCWDAEERSDDVRSAIDQVVTFLGLELARLQAIRSTELRFASELLDLINAGEDRIGELVGRLESFDVSARAPLCAVALAVEPADDDDEHALRALDGIAHQLGLRSVVVARNGEHLLILEASSPSVPAEVAEQLIAALEGDDAVRGAAVGVGSVVAAADRLRVTVNEARQACALARRNPGEYAVADYQQAGSHRMLLALVEPSARSSLAASLLDPLRAYDEQRKAELVPTLTAFLDSGCQWQRTAESLHIHVNTLRHRLARIETLIGRDLSSMADRVDLFLALRAADADA